MFPPKTIERKKIPEKSAGPLPSPLPPVKGSDEVEKRAAHDPVKPCHSEWPHPPLEHSILVSAQPPHQHVADDGLKEGGPHSKGVHLATSSCLPTGDQDVAPGARDFHGKSC